MPDIHSLKKQLRGIRSTQKITRAMKTTSTAKLSKLGVIFSQYSEFGSQCKKMLEQFGLGYREAFREADPDAPAVAVVIASNRGMCGNFNAEILKFAMERLPRLGSYRLVSCGKEAEDFFREKKLPVEKTVVFGDVPAYEESSALFDDLAAWRRDGKASRVYVIYPQYINILYQRPTIYELFPENFPETDKTSLLIPDQNTVVAKTAKMVFRAMFYQLVLESALGAQAATLMTMRSAYETATDYCARLESEINRLRQSLITADIIETSVKRDEE